jgi:hypothetical protein
MTKTEFETRIYKVSKLTLPVLQMIAAHNSGKTLINISVLEAHVKALRVIGMADWDCATQDEYMVISEGGKPALNIMLHTYVGSIDENNIIVKNEN